MACIMIYFQQNENSIFMDMIFIYWINFKINGFFFLIKIKVCNNTSSIRGIAEKYIISRTIRITFQVVALEVYKTGKTKRTMCPMYLPPTYQVTEEYMRDLMVQLPVLIILLEDFNAQNLLWGNEKQKWECWRKSWTDLISFA